MKKQTALFYLAFALPILISGCALEPESPPAAPKPVVKVEPVPEPTVETRVVQDLVQKWRNQGLNAYAHYQSTAKTVTWSLLRTSLPANPKQDEDVAREAARFAKTAAKPVQLLLSTSNRKNDARLGQVIKTAAQQSGGKNTVKFDHVIDARAPAMIQIQIREDK